MTPSPLARAACGLGLASLVACAPREAPQQVEFRVPVTVGAVGTGVVEDRVVATGSLRSREAVSLRADTSGALSAGRSGGRRLEEGDHVAAGQVIAEITGEEVRLASRSDSTRSRYETARRDHESRQRLFDEGLLSAIELRQSESALVDAKLDWERSQLTESRSKLVTPIAGIILRLARDEQGLPLADGQLVTQGYVLAQIAPIGRLVADVDLVGPDVPRVKPGMSARVRHHALGGSFAGRVERLAPSLDAQTRTLRTEIRVEDPEGQLRPGMFVEVTIVADRREDVPVIPRDAVTERAGTSVVFVLDGQQVSRRNVVLGLGDDEVIEIREGLKPGERIVIRGLETLTDGTKVHVSGAQGT